MRIIGGHDYYDSARAHGHDETLVLTRTRYDDTPVQKKLKLPTGWIPGLRDPEHRIYYRRSTNLRVDYLRDRGYRYVWRGRDFHVDEITVVFAGKIYHGAHVIESFKSDQVLWTLEEFDAWASSVGLTLEQLKRRSRWDREPREWTPSRECTASEISYLAENRVAIAIHDPASKPFDGEIGWRVNCDGLKERGFARLLDPYQALQELSMFVGGVLPRTPNPTVELRGEEIMTKKHGMDRWSFRRPGKKGMY